MKRLSLLGAAAATLALVATVLVPTGASATVTAMTHPRVPFGWKVWCDGPQVKATMCVPAVQCSGMEPMDTAWLVTNQRFVANQWAINSMCPPAKPYAATYGLLMQGDGNLVLELLPHGYAQLKDRIPLWSSGTTGHPGAYAVSQGDGNLVVYAPGHRPLWSSNTAGCTSPLDRAGVQGLGTGAYRGDGLWVAPQVDPQAQGPCVRHLFGWYPLQPLN